VAFAVGCAAEPTEDVAEQRSSIIGGKLAGDAAWPNVVWFPGTCTGTLIHPEVIVYAAHCGTDHDEVFIGSGADTFTSVPLFRCQAFADWEYEDGNDLAVCILAQPVDSAYAPIAVGCERSQVASGQATLLVGFGRTGELADHGVRRTVVVPFE